MQSHYLCRNCGRIDDLTNGLCTECHAPLNAMRGILLGLVLGFGLGTVFVGTFTLILNWYLPL